MFTIKNKNGSVVTEGITSPRYAANYAEFLRRKHGEEFYVDNFPELEYNEFQVQELLDENST